MTRLQELIDILDKCIHDNDIVCRKIRDKRKEISDHRNRYLASRATGTTLSLIGIGLAPFTAGTSLLLALGVGSAGMGMKITAEIINSKRTKEFIKDLNRLNTSRNEDFQKAKELGDEFSGIIQQHLALGLTTGIATGLALGEFGGFFNFGGSRLAGHSAALRGGGTLFEAPARLTTAMYGTTKILKVVTVEMGLSRGVNALGLASQGTAAVTKGTLQGVAVAAGIAFIVIDVGLLLNDLTKDSKATGEAYKIEEEIQEQTKTLTEFRNELQEYMAQLQRKLLLSKQLTSTCSSDDDEEECICKRIKLSVLYCNMQSANPFQENKIKLQKIKSMVQARRPNIVALVETWLSSKHSDQDVKVALGLEQYEIFRYDRCDNDKPFAGDGDDPTRESKRKGGGCLVAWLRNDLTIPAVPALPGLARHRIPTLEDLTGRYINFSAEQFPTRTYSYNDNLRSFAIDCAFNCDCCNQGRKFFSHSFRLVYRRPKPYRQAGDKEKQDKDDFNLLDRELLEQMCDHYESHVRGIIRGGYLGGVMVGDFNWSDGMCEEVSRKIQEAGLVNIPIPGRTINKEEKENPDMVFEFNGIVEQPIENLGFVSDHAALAFNLKLGRDYDYENPCPKCVE